MKIKELFKVGGVIQSFGGTSDTLDWHNCTIENKTNKEDALILHLKRKSDGEEGRVYLRVQEKFKNRTHELLKWAFLNKGMIGLTLNQLDNMETDLY
jgi:hypothetical protein